MRKLRSIVRAFSHKARKEYMEGFNDARLWVNIGSAGMKFDTLLNLTRGKSEHYKDGFWDRKDGLVAICTDNSSNVGTE